MRNRNRAELDRTSDWSEIGNYFIVHRRKKRGKRRLEEQSRTFVFRARHVSHAREARGTRRWEAHRGLDSDTSIVKVEYLQLLVCVCSMHSLPLC
jgi:hypothetical protein